MPTAQDWLEAGIDTQGFTTGERKLFCPKCGPTRKNKRDRSLSANLDTGVYKCHNDGCDFQGHVGPKDAHWTSRDVKPYIKPDLPDDWTLGPDASAYLESRNISPERAKGLGVYSHRKDGKETGLAFPYFRNGGVVHIKYRSIGEDKRFYSTKDSEHIFYNLDHVDGADTVIVCEGEMDVLSFAEAGLYSAISVPNGAPGLNKDGTPQDAGKKLDCMESGEAAFARAKRIIIATDNDVAGGVLRDELIRRLGREKCFTVEWPDDAKDANDVLAAYGPDMLRDLVTDARPVPMRGIRYASEFQEEIWNRRLGRHKRGWEAPIWPEFSHLFRLGVGMLTVVTGTPESGKSTWLRAYLSVVARNDDDLKCAMFVPEDGPGYEFFGKMARIQCGDLRNAQAMVYYDAMKWIDQHFIMIDPDSNLLEDILESARIAVLRHGVRALIIDPWTEVIHPRQHGVNEHEHINMCLARVQQFAKQYELAAIVVAHPTKQLSHEGGGPIGPYQISGAAGWYNKPDRILSVYRETKSDISSPTEVHVMKSRNKDFGRNGFVTFDFDPSTERYAEWTDIS